MNRIGNCKDCLYWKQVVQVGECHRYAPSPIMGKSSDRASWVETVDNSFCGDFVSKNPKKSQGSA